jgi:hypothetical protein
MSWSRKLKIEVEKQQKSERTKWKECSPCVEVENPGQGPTQTVHNPSRENNIRNVPNTISGFCISTHELHSFRIGENHTLPHYYLFLWVGDKWYNPSFLSTHCSQFILEDFFSLVYLPFSSWPLPVCSSSEGVWDVEGGNERGMESPVT